MHPIHQHFDYRLPATHDFQAASPELELIVTAIVSLPTGFCTNFPNLIMNASTQKGEQKRIVSPQSTEVTTLPSGAMLLTTFRRDDCQTKVFVNPIRTCENHLVWLSFTIEPIDEDIIGPLIFDRTSIRTMKLLMRDVEFLFSDIEDEVDLYGRSVEDVVADIYKAGIVSR